MVVYSAGTVEPPAGRALEIQFEWEDGETK